MNAMSNPTAETLHNLKFFAVPASWLVKVWPILSYRPGLDSLNKVPEKDGVGKICIAELVVETGADADVIDNDDKGVKPATALAVNCGKSNSYNNHNTKKNFDQAKASMERFHRRQMAQRGTTTKLIPGLQHAKDYFFLGERVWDIVKMKFGYDGYEICRTSCKATATAETGDQEQGTIAIALLPGEGMHAVIAEENDQNDGAVTLSSLTSNETVVVPATGRFPYEKILPTLTTSNDDDGDQVLVSTRHDKNNSVVGTYS
jgi:hypothetical protein